MIITTERLHAVQTSINKLIEQGQALFADIDETVQDRDRLQQDLKATERDRQRLQSRVEELEAMLDSVRATVEMAKPNGGQKTEPLAFRRRPDTPAGSQGLLPRDDKAIP